MGVEMSYFQHQLLEGLRRLAEHIEDMSKEDLEQLAKDLRKYSVNKYGALERQIMKEK
jgi:hypothetical protein